jgi:uncharacterized membrane protein (DUF2068 family)
MTYAPEEQALAVRLQTETPLGVAWRCLRCGDWVLGEPVSSGPASQAPVPARGRALRQLTILRILSVERGCRGILLLAAAYGVFRFAGAQTSLRQAYGRLVPVARPLAERLGVDLDQSMLMQSAAKALHTGQSVLAFVAVGLLLYGLLEAVESVGLWLAKRWAEYLTVVATAAFLPVELYELLKAITLTRLGALGLNLLIVGYLIVAKRLFGARGGRAASESELRTESLLEVEHAGTDRDYLHWGRPGREAGMAQSGVASGADGHRRNDTLLGPRA